MKKSSGILICAQDATCEVCCPCGESVWVSDTDVVRCPKCGKGYKTEFVVWEYELGEEDANKC